MNGDFIDHSATCDSKMRVIHRRFMFHKDFTDNDIKTMFRVL